MVVTVFDRAAEFASEGFYVFDKEQNILMCKYCNVRIEWQRKDTCLKHIKNSASHNKNKESQQSGAKRQVSLESALLTAKKAKLDKNEFIMSTTRAFIEANIPIEKLDDPKLRQWMHKYIAGAGDLPSASRIRKGYVPVVISEEEQRLKEAVKDQTVSILCDETSDRKGQCVFVVIIKVLGCGDVSVQKLLVGGVKVLANANANECSQAIVGVVHKLGIHYGNIVSITSDSARYMGKCINAIRVLVSEDLVHTQCWAHKLNLVGNIWAIQLSDLNNCVIQTKNLFLNTRKRKHAYMQFLTEKYVNDESCKPKLFPIPVLTRWNSWFKSVEYLCEFLHDIVGFVVSVEEESVAINYFKALASCEINKIHCQAVMLVEHCAQCCNLLLTLESSKIPMAHTLNSKLNDLSKSFVLLNDGFFFEKTSAALSKLPKHSQTQLTGLFKSVGEKCLCKLNQLIDSDSAKDFFSYLGQLFDHRNIMKCSVESNDDCILVKNIPMLKDLATTELIVPYFVFREQASSLCKSGKDVDPVAILLSLKSEHSKFVDAAVKALWIPANNVDSERSFSMYNNIMSDRRTNLSADNMELMLTLAMSD